MGLHDLHLSGIQLDLRAFRPQGSWLWPGTGVVT